MAKFVNSLLCFFCAIVSAQSYKKLFNKAVLPDTNNDEPFRFNESR